MVNPKIWGDAGWTFLFSVVADYPDNPGIDMQHHYKRFFFHLRWVLPCESCRENYEDNFRKWPIDRYLKSRAALFRWLANIFNETRRDQGKEPLSDPQIINKFFGPYGRDVPQEMVRLLCTARDPVWIGLSGNSPGGLVPDPQIGGGQMGGAALADVFGKLGLERPEPVMLMLLIAFLGAYYYLYTRRR